MKINQGGDVLRYLSRDKLPTILSTGLPLAACLAFVVFCALYVVGPYQNQNGDFGQYFVHSQNILKGRDWGFLMEDYPAVLPGYPLLLSAISAVFGTGYFFIGLINAILWATTSYLAFLHFREKFDYHLTKYVFLIACLSPSFVVKFIQDGQPNIFYSFSFMLCLFSVRYIEKSKLQWLAVFFFLLAATIRIDSVVLYVALFLFFLPKERRKFIWVPVFGIFLTIGLDVFIARQAGMKSNILHFLNESGGSVGKNQTLWESLSSFADLYIQYILAFFISASEIITPSSWRIHDDFSISAVDGMEVKFNLVQIVLSGLCLRSLFSVNRLFGLTNDKSMLSLERLIFMGHIAFIGLFMTGAIPIRYLLPVIPIYVFFVLFGLEKLAAQFKCDRRIACGVGASIALLFGVTNFEGNSGYSRAKNFMTLPATVEMADQLATVKADRPVAYWKPRLLTVMMDNRGKASEKTLGLRKPHQAEYLFTSERDGIAVVSKGVKRYTALNELLSDGTRACKTWESAHFAFYEAPAPGRDCL